MTQKQWYNLLLEDCCTMEVVEGGTKEFIRCKVELASPGTASCSNFCTTSYLLKNDSTELTMMSVNSVKQQDALKKKMLNTVFCTAKQISRLEGTS